MKSYKKSGGFLSSVGSAFAGMFTSKKTKCAMGAPMRRTMTLGSANSIRDNSYG